MLFFIKYSCLTLWPKTWNRGHSVKYHVYFRSDQCRMYLRQCQDLLQNSYCIKASPSLIKTLPCCKSSSSFRSKDNPTLIVLLEPWHQQLFTYICHILVQKTIFTSCCCPKTVNFKRSESKSCILRWFFSNEILGQLIEMYFCWIFDGYVKR